MHLNLFFKYIYLCYFQFSLQSPLYTFIVLVALSLLEAAVSGIVAQKGNHFRSHCFGIRVLFSSHYWC